MWSDPMEEPQRKERSLPDAGSIDKKKVRKHHDIQIRTQQL